MFAQRPVSVVEIVGMFAIRVGRDYVIEEDFFKAARKIKDVKKLETKIDYSKI